MCLLYRCLNLYNADRHPRTNDALKVHALVLYYVFLKIRMKAKIKNLPKDYSDNYFKARSKEKNALAICSNQSQEILSYEHLMSVSYTHLRAHET